MGDNMWQISYDDKPTLYLVATPIGNMQDMTFRAIDTLKKVDVVYSEDTRQTKFLFANFGIENRLITCNDINELTVAKKIVLSLSKGLNVALVSDRGTPIISDPGYKVVQLVQKAGYNVVSIPGACALIPALITSGLESESFLFLGFLNKKNIQKKLTSLVDEEHTLIFYESPHRVISTLKLMYKIFGDRRVSISREITKLHESIYRGYLKDAIKLESICGEIVIVVEGNKNNYEIDMDLVLNVDIYVKNGLTLMEAIKKVAKDRSMPKSDVYNEYHRRKQ